MGLEIFSDLSYLEVASLIQIALVTINVVPVLLVQLGQLPVQVFLVLFLQLASFILHLVQLVLGLEELVILDLQLLLCKLDFGSEVLFNLSYLGLLSLLESHAFLLEVFTDLCTVLFCLYLDVFLDELLVG